MQAEDAQICVVMVGLPARGKSYIAQKGEFELQERYQIAMASGEHCSCGSTDINKAVDDKYICIRSDMANIMRLLALLQPSDTCAGYRFPPAPSTSATTAATTRPNPRPTSST